MLTIALVVMVIFIFLRNFWATVIPAVTVPLSLIGTFAVLYELGYSLDNLSLMALSISVGFVVDDAVVVIENIVRHMEEGASPFEASLKGAGEIGFTIVSITLSLIAVFIPLFLMGGYVGLLLREFAITVSDNGVPALSATQSFAIFVEPPPAIQSITRSNSTITISWRAIAGTPYLLESELNLADPAWTNVVEAVTAVTNAVSASDQIGPAPRRFYRVRVGP